jgi:formylglycine-generating enzyme required for sulfatase activity
MKRRLTRLGVAVAVLLAFPAVSEQGAGEPRRLRRHVLAAGCRYSLSLSGWTHGAGTETGTVDVTSTPGCPWTATSNNAWLLVTGGASGLGSGMVSYTVAPNTGPERTGTLTIAGRVFTVTQQTAQQTFYLGPGNTVPLVFVKIPAGRFVMGAPGSEPGAYPWEKPAHQVTLTHDYYLSATEVTQGQWAAVMGTNPSTNCESHGIGDDYPVYCVSWKDVCKSKQNLFCSPTSFIGKLNALLGTTKLRLPTEAEWERAARGGASSSTPFWFDAPAGWKQNCDSFPEAAAAMWWCGNSGGTSHPVGSLAANQYGLFDMNGNLFEWVLDGFEPSYPSTPQIDPTGPPDAQSSGMVVRGGDAYAWAAGCRSAYRFGLSAGDRLYNIGFRLAMSQ